jgi:hypothetical protein
MRLCQQPQCPLLREVRRRPRRDGRCAHARCSADPRWRIAISIDAAIDNAIDIDADIGKAIRISARRIDS